MKAGRIRRVAVSVAVAVAAFAVLYAALGFIVFPYLVEQRLPSYAQARFDARAEVADVAFNPFTLSLRARGLRVWQESDLVANLERVHVDLQWSSLWRRGWRFDALRLDGAELHIVVEPDGGLNTARFTGDTSPDDGAPGSGRLPQVALEHAEITRGLVTFTDLSGSAPASAALRWVRAELTDLTTLSDEVGRYIVTAVLPGGGNLAWQGMLTLRPITSQGQLKLAGLQLETLWPFVRDVAQIAKPEGNADLTVSYDFAYTEGRPALAASDLQLQARDVRISPAEHPDRPVLALQGVLLEGGRFDLHKRELTFSKGVLRQGSVAVNVSPQGTVDWQRMFQTDEAADETPARSPLRFGVEALALADVSVQYVNLSSRTPMRLEAEALDAGLQLAVAAGGGATEVMAEELKLAAGRFTIAPVDGPAALQSDGVRLHGGTFRLANRQLVLPNATLTNAKLLFTVDRAGNLNWAQLFASRDAGTGDAKQAPAGAWRIGLPGLRGAGMQVRYVDRSRVEPLSVVANVVDGGLDLAIAPGTGSPVTVEQIALAARGLAVQAAAEAGAAALTLAAGRTRTGRYRDGSLVLEGVRLNGGTLRWLVAEDGASNWQRLLAQRSAPAGARPARASDKAGLHVQLPGMQVNDVSVHYRDRSRVEPLAIDLESVAATMNASTGRTQGAGALQAKEMKLAATGLAIGPIEAPGRALRLKSLRATNGSYTDRGIVIDGLAMADGNVLVQAAPDGTLNWTRLFARKPSATSGAPAGASGERGFAFRSPDIDIAGLQVRYVDGSRAQPATLQARSVDARLALRVDTGGSRTTVVADHMTLNVPSASLTPPGEQAPVATVGNIRVAGGRIDTGRNAIGAQRVAASGGNLRIVRDAQGRWHPATLMQPGAASGREEAGAAAPRKARNDVRRWDYALGSFTLENFDVAIADRAQTPKLSYAARIERLQIGNVDSRTKAPGTFETRIAAAQGGTLQANGNIGLAPLAASARVRLSEFDLRPMQPLLSRYAALDLESGRASMAANLVYRSAPGAKSLRVDGDAAIAQLQINESTGGAPFLAWKQASVNAIAYRSHSHRLQIGNVRVEAPRGKLEISSERQLNVLQVLRTAPGERTNGGAETSTPKDGDAPLEVRVGRLHLSNGTLHFADHSLALPFERDIENLQATIVDLSSRRDARARLEASGRIPPYGLAQASGSLNVAAPTDFTDIRAQFSNVRLPPLSPYTITFAGRAVAAGTLWLDVAYRIVDGELAGTNELTIENLQLGERVEAASPLDIPLELAVALLTDEQGRFRLRVPVRGNVDSPSFDYGRVIRSAITDTLRRVVTAPFRFIGRLFGGGEDLDSITFEPGSADLTPPQQEKLNTVATALKERPRVNLVVRPGFAPQADARALRADLVKRELARRSGLRLESGEQPGPVSFTRQQTQRALLQMAQERLSPELVRDPRPRTQGVSDAELAYYEALIERLVEVQPLPADPRELAIQRAAAIAEYLSERGEVDPKRIAPADPRQVQAAEDEAVETELRLRTGGA